MDPVPTTSSERLDQALASPPRDLPGVVATMGAIVAALPASDGVAVFTTLYAAVTDAVAGSADAQAFEDERFARALDVAFANLYFDALRGGAAPEAWAPLLEARARRDVFPLQFALAGMNAHINRDLPVALVRTCEALDLDLDAASAQRRDFRRIDGILASTEARVKDQFLTGELAEVDGALGQLDDCLAMWKVERAREAAWVNAETLWQLRGAPGIAARFLQALDGIVGLAGRGLLRPIVVAGHR